MKPRGFALLGFAPYIIGAIAVAALLGTAAWKWSAFKESLREEGRAGVRVEWQAERTQLIAARDAMVIRWAKDIQEVERVYVNTSMERESRFGAIRSRANSVGVSGGIRLSADAVGVLNDAVAAANPGHTAASRETQGAAQTIPESAGSAQVETDAGSWVTFAVDAADAYRDAFDKWQACVSWAGEIRAAQGAASSE